LSFASSLIRSCRLTWKPTYRQRVPAGAGKAPASGVRGATVLEGRLVNRETGEYKGYPLGRDEWPAGIEEAHAVQDRD
jgi:hypothetical protein